MNKILKILVLLPAILFVVTGLRWLVAPAGVAPMFGLTLADGVGLSSQVGDMSAFFLTAGICMLVALVSGQRAWYYPPMMMLLLTAMGRILAWLVHDAALAVDLIAPEIIVGVLLIVAARRLPESA
jgi:hypothetical protein